MKRILHFFLTLCFAVMTVVSGFQIYRIYREYQKGTQYYETLRNEADFNYPETTESTVHTLQQRLPDTAAWLRCEGTEIDYPVVQGDDNFYYLSHLPDGTECSSGTLFLDCRCSSDFSDQKLIIYGHNMKNGSMFGTLSRYRRQDYYEQHPELLLFTPNHTYVLEILAGFSTSADSELYQPPYTGLDMKDFIQQCRSLSDFTSRPSSESWSQILVLSTCSSQSEKARYVLIAGMRE
ncbi:MAG: class B sortase [Oscillospiraceae bacterium]|nr:class B sortase [Oscillospiraceae bacterium]